MNSLTYLIDLDCLSQDSQAIIYAKLAERNGRKIVFSMYEGRTPYVIPEGVTAVFRASKPSGAVIYNTCTVVNGKVEYTLTAQTVAELGAFPCEIQLVAEGGGIIYSPRVTLVVIDNIYSDVLVESSDEFTALTQAILDANNLNIEVEQADDDVTITLTKKDGTQQTVRVHGGGSASWGNISGDLQDQEDLYGTLVSIANEISETEFELEQGYFILNEAKQDKLIAGEGITIAADGKTISASGGGVSYDDTELRERIATIEGKEASWNAKQNAIADLAAIRSGAALGATALQSVPNTYRTAAQQDIIDNGKQPVGDYALRSEQFSGNYNDLTNKPTIPTVPQNVSAFTNDSGYLTLGTLPIYNGEVV